MLNLRQAKVLRAMLHLGSFTASEIVRNLGEDARYVANLVSKWKGLWLEERRLLKLGKVGPPEAELCIKPEHEQQLLAELEPVYREQEKIMMPEVFRFVGPATSSPELCKEVEVRVLEHRKVVLSEHETISGMADDGERGNIVTLGSADVASGLAKIFKLARGEIKKPVAIVNMREALSHVVVVEDGKTLGDFSCDFSFAPSLKPTPRRLRLLHIVEQIELAVSTIETLTNKRIEDIFLTGNIAGFRALKSLVKTKLGRDCEIFDPGQGVTVQTKGSLNKDTASVGWSAEICYALGSSRYHSYLPGYVRALGDDVASGRIAIMPSAERKGFTFTPAAAEKVIKVTPGTPDRGLLGASLSHGRAADRRTIAVEHGKKVFTES
jgi:hypothetical protein